MKPHYLPITLSSRPVHELVQHLFDVSQAPQQLRIRRELREERGGFDAGARQERGGVGGTAGSRLAEVETPGPALLHNNVAVLRASSSPTFGRLFHATFDDDVRYQTCANKECTLIATVKWQAPNFAYHYFDETRGEPVRPNGVKKNDKIIYTELTSRTAAWTSRCNAESS